MKPHTRPTVGTSRSRPHKVWVDRVLSHACMIVPGLPVLHGCAMSDLPASVFPEFYTPSSAEGKRLRRCAAAAACNRFDTPSFAMMWETWTLTVLSLMNRRLAICWFE